MPDLIMSDHIKQTLREQARQMPWLALTGRVDDWLKDPDGRLPVSCTVRKVSNSWQDVLDSLIFASNALRYAAGVAINLEEVIPSDLIKKPCHPITVMEPGESDSDFLILRVEDSMESEDPDMVGIQDSWKMAGELAELVTVSVDLSKLRPAGTVNSKGLVASGPESFALIYATLNDFMQDPCLGNLLKIYSMINGTLRRGGVYKNGAITVHLNWDHPEVLDYLTQDPSETPWIKRCLTVTPGILGSPHLDLILSRVADGSLWLNEMTFDAVGNRIYGNVCQEIYLKSRGSCLLAHLNLGRLTAAEIATAYPRAMEWLCQLHGITGVGESGIYLDPSEDKQVGLGLLGLASHLAIHNIKYADLAAAVEVVSQGWDPSPEMENSDAYHLALCLKQGIQRAAEVARKYGMERSFTIAPTASCAYRHTDSEGWATTPEISPPLNSEVERDSETFGIEFFDYHPNVEIAGQDVEWSTYYQLCNGIQRLYDSTGLGHAISMNLWSPGADCDRRWLEDFIASPVKSTYYRLPVAQNLAKDRILSACDLSADCTACAE